MMAYMFNNLKGCYKKVKLNMNNSVCCVYIYMEGLTFFFNTFLKQLNTDRKLIVFEYQKISKLTL